MQAKQAALLFEQSASEALPVVVDQHNWTVIGLLSEAHLLRRYAEEVDKARMELAGERV
jgi:CIC family chloride channel protein